MPLDTPVVEALPKKLKHDAIIEAVFEIRFEAKAATVPEVFYGKLADTAEWRNFRQQRLPAADIPAAIRRADPDLRFQPSIDLVHPDDTIVVRMGPQVLGYVRRTPYPGWSVFGPEIVGAVDTLFALLPTLSVSRLGLRYINAFNRELHDINSLGDLDIDIRVSGAALTDHANINYRLQVNDRTACVARIASTDFVKGNIPENSSVIADFDVFWEDITDAIARDTVVEWVNKAHDVEKINFFRVLRDETVRRLRVD